MPTRLPVLLHRRKSAAAGVVIPIPQANAQTPSMVRRAAAGAVLICGSRVMELRISRRLRRAVNDDGAEVVDVREGRAGAEKTARVLEKGGGIVVGKNRGRFEAEFRRPRGGCPTDQRAGGILRGAGPAIRAVGIGRQRRDA